MSSSVNFVGIAPSEEPNFKNPDKHITKIKPTLFDFSRRPSVETLLEQIKNCLETSSIAVTLEENKEQKIKKVMDAKMPLIKARNKILDNPLKYLFPYYRKKLVQIDSELDKLDLALYQLEKENSIEATKLNDMVLAAQEKLAKYSRYFPIEVKNTIESSTHSKFSPFSKTLSPEVKNNERRPL